MHRVQPNGPGSSDERFAELCALAESEMARLGVPGVAIGVIDGEREHLAGMGVTSVENPLPVDADTLFQIGSTTKTVTGTIAMRLAERGALDLDAPVRRYLPELRLADESVAARVTLRHLFTHTGGWAGDYFDDLGNGDDALARIVERMAELPQLTPLGEIWSYNNAGFYVAGRVIERVTGTTYEQAAHDLILAPLGMDHSFFFPGDIMTRRFVAGHENSYPPDAPAADVARPWPLARTAHPVGGISSTARDQMRYARFHMGDGTAADGTRLLAPERLAEMREPGAAAANGERMGVAWFLRDADGVRLARHGGATKGQQSAFLMAPARQFAITVLTNAQRGGELHQALVRRALELFLSIEEAQPAPLERSAAELAPYAGLYTALLADCDLRLEGDTLVLRYIPHGGFPAKDSPPPPAPPPVRMAFCADDAILALDEPFRGARGEFLRDAAGAIAWLRFGGRVQRREADDAAR
jgi:CubicO group peptidase (beta-lactamase class C family)